MAVPAVPFYASQANQEFLGTTVGYLTTTLSKASIPAPRYASELAGKSAFNTTHTMVVGGDYPGSYAYIGFDYTKYGSLTPNTIQGTVGPVEALMSSYNSSNGVKYGMLVLTSFENGNLTIKGSDGSVFNMVVTEGVGLIPANQEDAWRRCMAQLPFRTSRSIGSIGNHFHRVTWI